MRLQIRGLSHGLKSVHRTLFARPPVGPSFRVPSGVPKRGRPYGRPLFGTPEGWTRKDGPNEVWEKSVRWTLFSPWESPKGKDASRRGGSFSLFVLPDKEQVPFVLSIKQIQFLEYERPGCQTASGLFAVGMEPNHLPVAASSLSSSANSFPVRVFASSSAEVAVSIRS